MSTKPTTLTASEVAFLHTLCEHAQLTLDHLSLSEAFFFDADNAVSTVETERKRTLSALLRKLSLVTENDLWDVANEYDTSHLSDVSLWEAYVTAFAEATPEYEQTPALLRDYLDAYEETE